MKEQIIGDPHNYTWEALKKSSKFGAFDQELLRNVMTLVGTIVTTPPSGSEHGPKVVIYGPAEEAVVTALLDGTANAPVKILKCNNDLCTDVSDQTLNVPASSALRPRIATMIKSMSSKIAATAR
jgi:conjugative transfer pilus assembly protein TraH